MIVSADPLKRSLLVNTLHVVYDVAAVQLRLHDLEFVVLVIIYSWDEILLLQRHLIEIDSAALVLLFLAAMSLILALSGARSHLASIATCIVAGIIIIKHLP